MQQMKIHQGGSGTVHAATLISPTPTAIAPKSFTKSRRVLLTFNGLASARPKKG